MPGGKTRPLTGCDKRGEAVSSNQPEVERVAAGRRGLDEDESRLIPRLGEAQDRRCGRHFGGLEGVVVYTASALGPCLFFRGWIVRIWGERFSRLA